MPLSWKCRIRNTCKNHNLYLHQSKITLPPLLWDTLYVSPKSLKMCLRNIWMNQEEVKVITFCHSLPKKTMVILNSYAIDNARNSRYWTWKFWVENPYLSLRNVMVVLDVVWQLTFLWNSDILFRKVRLCMTKHVKLCKFIVCT